MSFQQEEEIRQYIEARLKQQGIAVQREVACGNGIRADLVTSDRVIEIKRQLNRGAIYQAYGQGVAYQKLLNKPKLLIIGLAPSSESKYQEAQRIAENVRTESVEVVFIDKDPDWGLAAASVGALGGKPAKPASKPASQSAAKSGKARLPFEPVPASIAGDVIEKIAEKVEDGSLQKAVEQVAEKVAEKVEGAKAKPAEVTLPVASSANSKAEAANSAKPTAAAKPAASPVMKDFWILLLIILVFLGTRTYLRSNQPVGPRLADPAPVSPIPASPLYQRPLRPSAPRPNPTPRYRGS